MPDPQEIYRGKLTTNHELGDLIAAGSVTNSHQGLYDGLSVAAFAAGTDKL